MQPPEKHDAADGRPDGPKPRLRFPKAARLALSAEFARVRDEGRSVHGRLMLIGILDTRAPGTTRTGIVTSRKIGGAVIRNRVRRRLREIVRNARPALRAGLWLVLVAKPGAAKVASGALAAEWTQLATKARIFQP